MFQDRTRSAWFNALVAVAAGAASALLFFLASRGAVAGMVMSYFSPLPLMVATFGFGVAVGAAAVLTGGLVAGLLGHPLLGLVAGGALFFPAFLVCVVFLLAPVRPQGGDTRVSRALLVSVLFAAGMSLAAVTALVVAHGGYAAAHNAVTNATVPLLRSALQGSRLPPGLAPDDVARVLIGIAPALLAASTLFMLVANAYLAARAALISGQLEHPWPAVADSLALPAVCAILFAVACGLVFVGGLPGMLASIVATALGAGFALQGLAVAHVLTRGLGARAALLALLYAILFLLPPWPLFVLALVGFADAAFHLRRRRAGAAPGKP